VRTRVKQYVSSAFAHVQPGLLDGTPFRLGDNDSGDAAAFVRATKFIGSRDAVEEFVPCGMHPLAASVGFDKVATLVTPVSKLRVPLPKFVVVRKDDEDDVLFLCRVELEAEGIMGSYTCPEHDACVANLRNRGRLNWVFEFVEVAYGHRPAPGTEEFTEASKKGGWMLLERIWANTEVASARPVKQTKKAMFCPAMTVTITGTSVGASGSKVVVDTKKTTMLARKRRIPAIGVMAEASSSESQVSSPHGQTAPDSMPEIVSMPEPHGLSPQASVPDTAYRAVPRASL
jgi:hypothetical protein